MVKLQKLSLSILLFKQAFGRYKFQIAALAVLGFVSGIVGGIGINALIPLLSFITGEGQTGSDFISRNIVSFFEVLGFDFNLASALVFIVLLFLIKAIILVIFSYINMRIISSYEESTRSRLFRKMVNSKWQYLLDQKLGHLEKILMHNVEQSRNFLALIGIAIMVFVNLIVYTLVAINISFKITVLSFILGGILFLIIIPLLKRIKKISSVQEKINRDVAHHINENIMGMKAVKSLSQEKTVASTADRYFRDIRDINIKTSILNALTGSLAEPATVIFIAIIFALFYKTAGFPFASLLVLMYVIKQILAYIRQVQDLVLGVNVYTPYLEKVIESEALAEENSEDNSASKPFVFKEKLLFNDVSFSYNSSDRVLKNIQFHISYGEMVGLIGPSGSGKTTLVDLMLRLFNPEQGEILLDGIRADEISLPQWRKNIGYVSQDVFLINASIKDNIQFYDETVSEEDIIEAARMADIYDFIMTLPKGFNTSVGERGVLLSGGQRQRISIARALARKPKILILDEATSALDNESETKIQNVIKNLKGKLSVVVIAHRLSTIQAADRIIALKDGQIQEEGTPTELLGDKDSYFYKVYNIRK